MSAQAKTERPYLNAEQVSVIRELTQKYQIDPGDITFLSSGEPWLPSRVRLEIARQSEQFASISESFDQFIPALCQVVHSAEVLTQNGLSFRRSGVATIDEKLPNSEIADCHELAASRALGAALDAAGFNPLKRRPRIQLMEEDPAATRLTQLKAIHAIAREAGLIVRPPGDGPEDDHGYREFLARHYHVITVAGMNEAERSSVIAALRIKARG